MDTSDWPSLGSEGAAGPSKKDSSSNGEAKDGKDGKKATNSKNGNGKPGENAEITTTTTHLQAEKAKDLKDIAPVVTAINENDAQKSKSPVPELNNHLQQSQQQQQHVVTTNTASSSAAAASKDKHVPKSIEDGSKRVSKPKWARLDVDTKSASAPQSNQASSQQQNRRRSPPRRRGDDYRDYRDDRSIRRSGSNRGNVPSHRSGPRNTGGPNPSVPSTTTTNSININNNNTNNSSSSSSSMKPGRGGSTNASRRDNPTYITRSNRPSYTESKTPGLNGNPIKPTDSYDSKKPKPSLIGRPIIIEAPITPIVTNVFGTYYFNGPAPFTIDTIGNIKESIKKQM